MTYCQLNNHVKEKLNYLIITSLKNIKDVVHQNSYWVLVDHSQQVYQMVIENLDI